MNLDNFFNKFLFPLFILIVFFYFCLFILDRQKIFIKEKCTLSISENSFVQRYHYYSKSYPDHLCGEIIFSSFEPKVWAMANGSHWYNGHISGNTYKNFHEAEKDVESVCQLKN